MTKTYSQLVKQIEALKRQADDARKKEAGGVILRIKEAISFYGLTVEDLFAERGEAKAQRSGTVKSARARKLSAEPKFRDDAGNVWSGRGPRPHWLRNALASGKQLEDFATGSARSSATARKAPAKKAISTVKFRDDAGHSWSGRGPKPRWLLDALSAGKKLEDLAA